MTVEIYQHDGDYEDYSVVAVFEDGAWLSGSDDVDPHGHYEGAPEEVIIDDFDGPGKVASAVLDEGDDV